MEKIIEQAILKITGVTDAGKWAQMNTTAIEIAQEVYNSMMKDAEQIRFDCSLPCKTFNNLKAKGIEIGDKLLIIKE